METRKDKLETKESETGEREKISLLLEDLAFLESYTKDLFNFLPVPVCFLSPVGIILEANPAFEQISGYKLDEIVGNSVEAFFKTDEVEVLIQETNEKGFIKGKEMKFLVKEKKEIPVSISAILRKSGEGEINGYLFSFFDLSDVKKREEKLEKTQRALLNILEDVKEERERAEEEKNRTLAIIQNFADGILIFDEDNRLLMVNPKAESFFKIEQEEILGKSFSEFIRVPPLSFLTSVFEDKIKPISRKEVKVRNELILEVTTTPILIEGKTMGNLMILHDVTREKEIEKMKTEFVSVSAHQLRTPLSAIKWTLKMLLDGDLGELTKEQKEFVRKTYESNERMINLVNDLLNVTRIEEGRYLYHLVSVDFVSIVESLIKNYEEEAKRKDIDIYFQKPEKLAKVKVDVEKITLAVQNLLENAIKYTLPGGIVVVAIEEKKKEVEFSIKDTGVGIPKDQQHRIFTKFFRGTNAIKLETEGSGLGLFIAKNIIESHGGRIWFKSEEGKGTTFYFTLPLEEKFEEFLKKV